MLLPGFGRDPNHGLVMPDIEILRKAQNCIYQTGIVYNCRMYIYFLHRFSKMRHVFVP